MRRVSAIAVVLVFSLAACGGDSGGGSSDSGDGGSVGALDAVRCAEVAAALAQAQVSATQALTGTIDPQLQSQIDTLEGFAGEAPDEIADAMQTIADGYAAFSQALEGADFDPASGVPPPPEAIAQLEAASQQLNTPEFQEATQMVSTWFATECGAPAGG